MSAETLRRAAALMRERATDALDTEGSDAWYEQQEVNDLSKGQVRLEDSAYIASWHPAVALAVADWLDRGATNLDADPDLEEYAHYQSALTVARAYLGESA